MTAFDEAGEPTTKGALSSVSRRTIVKGAAWSVPIVAATVAVPSYAASPDCAGTATVTANDYEKGVLTVTLPACARTVSYVIVGGGGGDALSGSYSGAGAKVAGTFAVSGGEVLSLVAGGGGGSRNMAPNRATGWGDGGLGTLWYHTDVAEYLLNGAGGGAGSAIVLGPDPSTNGTPLIVAGGGGGMPCATAWANDTEWMGAKVGWGGQGEPYQDNIGDGSMSMEPNYGPGEGNPMTEFARHGVPGSSTAAGAGGALELSGTQPLVRGFAGGDASGHNGGDAGSGDPRDPEQTNLHRGSAGGGGGGWFGGGGGAGVYAADRPLGAGGGGGAGSNYYGGATPGAAANVGSVTVPYPTALDNGTWDRNADGFLPGSVTITWS